MGAPCHQSHRGELAVTLPWLVLLFVLFVVVLVTPLPWADAGVSNYLPLHTLLETLSIVVGALVFAVGWHAARRDTPRNVLILSSTLLGVSILDFSHLLSYAGMPNYVTPSGPDKAIHFWLAARGLAALGLLCAAALPWSVRIQRREAWPWLLAVLLWVGVVHWVVLWHPEMAPRMYAVETGLTPLKIGLEYGLVLVHAVAAGWLWLRLQQAREFNTSGLLGAVCVMAMGELFFTLYSDVTDAYNLAGHLYKVAGYGFVYWALFVETVERPYVQLDQTLEQLRATVEAVPDMLFELDETGRFLSARGGVADQSLGVERVVGHTIDEWLNPDKAALGRQTLKDAALNGEARVGIIDVEVAGTRRWFEFSVARKRSLGEPGLHFVVLAREVTERMRLETDLRSQKQLLDQILNHIQARVYMKDGDGRYLYVNHVMAQEAGQPRAFFLGKTAAELAACDDDLRAAEADMRALQHGEVVSAQESRTDAQGVVRHYWTSRIPLHLPDQSSCLIGVATDITELKRARDAIEQSEVRFRTLFEMTGEAVVVLTPERFIDGNEAALQLLGFKDKAALRASPAGLLTDLLPAELKPPSSALKGVVCRRRRLEGVIRPQSNPQGVPVELWVSVLELQGQALMLATLHDLTESKRNEERILSMAFHDDLTGLPNRRLLLDRLSLALAQVRRNQHHGALVFLDLDNFKPLNDRHGHEAGDLLLKEVAQRLKRHLRAEDTVARQGGDEFVALLAELDKDQAQAQRDAMDVAEKIRLELEHPYVLQAVDAQERAIVHRCSASVGVTLFSSADHSVDDILRRADDAMYKAKAAGRNTVAFMPAAAQRGRVFKIRVRNRAGSNPG